ncbi:leishmanolysin-like peptidase [Ostrea edulis]|uniref:leishmanolysin-like peptidase n=1 Tax=Ostrea edulis TaxID=37623 RepID=UPI0020940AEC|nr:leishmanolysin-like peptidase [Ostrea edulis]
MKLVLFTLHLITTITRNLVEGGHDCVHRPPTPEEVIYDVKMDSHLNLTKRSIHEQLRIKIIIDDSIKNLPYSHQSLINTLVQEAAQYWENTLKIKRSSASTIRLNRQCVNNMVVYERGDRYCVGYCSPKTKCGDFLIPEQHLERCYYHDQRSGKLKSSGQAGTGVTKADFILYVAALPSAKCQQAKTIAYAAHCQQEIMLDRPVAGYISICPDSVSTRTHDRTQLLSTMKHEILHALGFSAGLYAFYRDQYGNPLTSRDPSSNKPKHTHPLFKFYIWSDRVMKEVIRYGWKTAGGGINRNVRLIVTPAVQREVRRHFNCPSLEGAEVENQGIYGTSVTHWEKRLFENEVMTGTYTQNPVISRVTLALMEDTGWYQVNYNMAEDLEWGKNLGCNFVTKSCKDWMDSHRPLSSDMHPYCKQLRQGMLRTDCTRNRKAVAFCNLVEYSGPIPPEYQYFTSGSGVQWSGDFRRLGGSVELADYCPYLQEFIWRENDVNVRDSRCFLPGNVPKPSLNFYGESYGANSLCVNHGSSLWTLQQCNRLIHTTHAGSGCYQFECHQTAGLVLYVQGMSYQCLQTGQRIHVRFVSTSFLHDGYIICPHCPDVCHDRGVLCPKEVVPYDIINNNTPDLHIPCGAITYLRRSNIYVITAVLVLLMLCLRLTV